MPYKDLERKRQWEQEHRDQRNARRRAHRIAMRVQPSVPKTAPDPISDQKPQSIWTVVAKIAGFALAVGIGLLAGASGASAAGHIDETKSCSRRLFENSV